MKFLVAYALTLVLGLLLALYIYHRDNKKPPICDSCSHLGRKNRIFMWVHEYRCDLSNNSKWLIRCPEYCKHYRKRDNGGKQW